MEEYRRWAAAHPASMHPKQWYLTNMTAALLPYIYLISAIKRQIDPAFAYEVDAEVDRTLHETGDNAGVVCKKLWLDMLTWTAN